MSQCEITQSAGRRQRRLPTSSPTGRARVVNFAQRASQQHRALHGGWATGIFIGVEASRPQGRPSLGRLARAGGWSAAVDISWSADRLHAAFTNNTSAQTPYFAGHGTIPYISWPAVGGVSRNFVLGRYFGWGRRSLVSTRADAFHA